MTSAVRQVGVVLRRTPLDNPWIDHVWSPEAILPGAPDMPAGTRIGMSGESQLIYSGASALELYPSETAQYRDNLMGGAPQIWVALRKQSESGDIEVIQVTADPTEGESHHEAGADLVAPVPMPADVAAWVAAFVEEFHVERAFIKRKRDKSGPDPRKNPGVRMGGGGRE